MENTQTNNTPQPPKKSFWEKLFGPKNTTSATTTAAAQIPPSNSPVESSVPAPSPAVSVVVDPATSEEPIAPVVQDIPPVAAPVVAADAPVFSPGVTTIEAPVQNTTWSMPTMEEVPTPPSDPMVTPLATPQVEITPPTEVPANGYQPSVPYVAPIAPNIETILPPVDEPISQPPVAPLV